MALSFLALTVTVLIANVRLPTYITPLAPAEELVKDNIHWGYLPVSHTSLCKYRARTRISRSGLYVRGLAGRLRFLHQQARQRTSASRMKRVTSEHIHDFKILTGCIASFGQVP